MSIHEPMPRIEDSIEMSRRVFLSRAGAASAALFASPILAAGGEPQNSLTGLTLQQAATLVRQRKVSPVALTEACLARIEKYNPVVNAFITVTPERALADARAAEHEISRGGWRGPLHGIPIALKDLIDTAGVRTTAASAVFAGRIPTEDAEVVRRLKVAGAVVLGKTNMDEFAAGDGSVTSHWGPTHNPWALERVPGSSSGGSAAAVAAELCYGALGTDTGGSIRQPASYCGVVGLKPTYGLVSNRGVIPLVPSLDCVGPMGRTVGDIALLLQGLAGHDPRWAGSSAAAVPDYSESQATVPVRFRIGIPRADFFESLDDEVRQGVAAAIEVLRRLAADIHDVVLPFAYADLESQIGALLAEAYAYHKPLLERAGSLYHPFVRKALSTPRCDSGYVLARQAMERERLEIKGIFNEVDLLVLPTAKSLPKTIEHWLTDIDSSGSYDLRNYYTTWAFNILGLPALSVPCGFTRSGLPVGLQIVSAPFQEARILALAHAYEATTGWHRRKPTL